MTSLIDLVGWAGAGLVLVAYGLLSLGRLHSTSRWYQLMNLVGSIGLATNSYWNGAFPSVVLNLVWMAFGAIALLKTVRRPDRGEPS